MIGSFNGDIEDFEGPELGKHWFPCHGANADLATFTTDEAVDIEGYVVGIDSGELPVVLPRKFDCLLI